MYLKQMLLMGGEVMQLIKKHKKHMRNEMFVMIIIMIFHLLFAFMLQSHAIIDGDGIFTYTLANNPYSFEYIDPAYDKLPQNNGWINAHILRESYIVEEYDRFNYSSVYFHQRIDNHPLLYYSLVHTICSFFTGSYSRIYTMIINLLFLCLIDILVIKLFEKIYGKAYYSAVPFTLLFLMVIMQQLYSLPRMYLMLAFFCLWYLYLHWEFITNDRWEKSYLKQMVCCIFLGTQTHYYFYVYAGTLTLLTLIYLLYKRNRYNLFNYIYSGIIGIIASWILFPWIIWHIFFNQMKKHTDITPWSLEKLSNYIEFLNVCLFNGRGIIALVIFVILLLIGVILKKQKKEYDIALQQRFFTWIVFGSGLTYSLIIFTLDEAVWYYSTPLYLVFIIWFSMAFIKLLKKVITHDRLDIVIVFISVACALSIFSISETADYVSECLEKDRVNTQFSNSVANRKQYDCIFIEKEQDNLLQGYWFEFGDYDEFKKISFESFRQTGLREEDLIGRNTNNDLIIYAPIDCIFNEQEYEWLGSNGKYNIYKMVERVRN